MDLLARRVAMAERQVARRAARRKEKPSKFPAREARQDTTYRLAMARIARREDWHLGPLAPRRDVPTSMSLPRLRHPLSDTLGSRMTGLERQNPPWGAIDRDALALSFEPADWQKEERWAWAGGSKFPNLAVGDRVVVVEGSYKGQIGKVESIDMATATLKIENIGMVNTQMPDFIEEERGISVSTMQSSFPVSGVRLVYPLPDPETGVTRDVIIKQLVHGGVHRDRPTARTRWHRLVPGLNVKIPWPRNPPADHQDQAADTLRIDVEKTTFVPTLTAPPMPASVIDELRNRFSKFRTRHTDEYVAKKQAEVDAKKSRAAMVDSMLTPVQLYNRAQREKRAALPPPVLTDAMLAKIGEVMARNRAAVLAAAGAVVEEAAAAAPPPTESNVESHAPPS